MSKSTSTGYTDTAIEGNPTLNLLRGSLNFPADFKAIGAKSGEVKLTNITSPLDRPEQLRIGRTLLNDVYSKANIVPSYMSPSKEGIQLLVQLTEVLSVTESTDTSYRIDLPVSYHLVIKVPRSEFITAAVVQTGVARLLSGLYDTGVTTTTRLDGLLKGALMPSDV